MTGSNRVGIIVPTKDRKSYLLDLIKSVANQDIKIEWVTIVDSSEPHNRLDPDDLRYFQEILGDTKVRTIISETSSAPFQRNLGIASVPLDACDFILFLDDDTRPSHNYVSLLINAIESDSEVVGASGITGYAKPLGVSLSALVRRLFFLSSNLSGQLLCSGINTPIYETSKGDIIVADWLFGCSLWKSEIFKQLRFPNYLPGGALYDDVIFSAQANKLGKLLVVTDAILVHLLASENRAHTYLHSIRWVRNRYELVKISSGDLFSITCFWWSVIGEIVLNLKGLSRVVIGRRDLEAINCIARIKGLLMGSLLVLRKQNPI